MHVLVTGATGFVGRILCETLSQSGHAVRAAVRTAERAVPEGAERVVIGDLAKAEWGEPLRGVHCVVHAAGLAHVSGAFTNPDLYLQVNAHATRRLVEAAARARVHRLVYLSSIKVNGEGANRPYSERDQPQPQDAYGQSKWLGERYAIEAASAGSMGLAIVRPPLVYGAGVGANFLRLMDWVDRGWPLPLGAIENRRSLVSVWNLCDLLDRLLTHDAAPGRTWMVSDSEDLSTPELARRLARAMGRPARLFAMPTRFLRWTGTLAGRGPELARLTGSLTVDIDTTQRELGWVAPISVNEGIDRTVRWYCSRTRAHAA